MAVHTRLFASVVLAVLPLVAIADTLDDKIIATNSEVVFRGVRNVAPRLDKTGEEKRGPVVVETYVSGPSKVRLVLETLPGRGFLPNSAAVIRATMERPLADKPSPYDGGLAKTIDAFVFNAAQDWPAAEQKAFVGSCLTALSTTGCDRTVKGVRVVAKRIGADAFKIEAFTP
jgi:hypothetical protein